MTGFLWFCAGWTAGILTLMQAQVIAARRARRDARDRHPSNQPDRTP